MFDQEEINRWNAMMMWGGERAQEVEAGQVMLQVRRRASANCVLLCVVHVLHALVVVALSVVSKAPVQVFMNLESQVRTYAYHQLIVRGCTAGLC